MTGQDETSAYERRTAVAVLCSDLAHELGATLLFLRDAVARETDPLDRSIGEEELARLESILHALRRTRRPEAPVASLTLAAVAQRVVHRLRATEPYPARVELDIPAQVTLQAREPAFELLLAALLRNACAASASGDVWVRARSVDGVWLLEVEDDGPGLPASLADRLFHPLATLGEGGAGSGVPSALAIAREHGWELDYMRAHGRTVVRVELRQASARSEAP